MMRLAWCVVAAVAGGSLWAQEQLSARMFLQPAATVLAPQQVAFYWVQESALQGLVRLPVREFELRDFPLSVTEVGTVRLRRARSVVDGQTQWWRGLRPARQGEPELLAPAPGIVQLVFEGEISGEAASRLVLSVVGGELYGIIRRGDGRSVALVPTGQRWGESVEHTLSPELGAELTQWMCAVEQVPEYWEWLRTAKEPPPPQPQAVTLRQARVAVEALSSLYLRFNRDYDRLAAYIASLFAMVSRIYEDEVNVTFTLPWVLIWLAPPEGEEDPYQNDNNIGALLSEVSTYWNQNRRSVTRDLVHVMTAPGVTEVGGIARLNTLCQTNSAYSISGIRGTYQYPTLSYTWDVHVVAHEIGHVFGAPHTHACYWSPPLDTCVTRDGNPPTGDACYASPIRPRSSWDGGSIMSYCHLVQPSVALTFRPRVAVVIRSSRAETCLQPPPAPVVLLQYPVGNQQFRGGEPLEIRWTSWQVQLVSLEYSTDTMRTWIPIATGVPAAQRSYSWTLPRQFLPRVWLRIFDLTNPTVGDTVLASFSVAIPSLSLGTPRGGERYGYGEQVAIEWSKSLVEAVNVLFSPDGGSRWDTLARGITGITYSWQVPQQATARALIRVEDARDPTVADQSEPFAIGAPVLQLLSPNGGERWTVGSRQQIRWFSDFVSRIRIDYSTDGGQSWRTVRLSYDATTQSYEWEVPNTPTDQALVRLQNRAHPEQQVQSAAPFVIEGQDSGTHVAERPSAVQLRWAGVEGRALRLRLWLGVPLREVQLRLVTVLGQRLTEHSWALLPEGEQDLWLSLPEELAQGIYVLQLRALQGQWVLSLGIVR